MSVLIIASSLVTAIALGKERKAPAEIIFIPEGSNKIFPLSHKDGITVNVPPERGDAIAAALQSALAKRMGEDVKPWTDFEHTRKSPASAYPTGFRYGEIMTDDGPRRGVIVAMDWSGKGSKSVEDRDVCYFSPEFTVDENGVPDGLPARGPLGGLVAEPAFRKGMAIAAADAGEEQEPNTPPIMSKLIFAALAISAAAENAETEAVQAIEKLKSENATVKASFADKDKEIKELSDKVKASEDAEKKALAERADTLVKAAVADGRIPAKDEDKQKKFREKITAGDTFAEEILSQLPKLNPGLGSPIITGGLANHVVAANDIEGKAQQLVTAGQAPDLDTAIGIVASENPKAYSDYLASLA